MSDFVKKPCSHCPYRKDIKPFLRPERGEELAYNAQNPYSEFYCHKTLETGDHAFIHDNFVGESSKICAGFLSLQHNELGKTSYDHEGFVPSSNVYEDVHDMIDAFAEEN